MSENQPENNQEVASNNLSTKLTGVLQNWKVKTGLIVGVVISIVIGLFLINFFWAHIVAGIGMNSWSKRAKAAPIECMIKDTNNDGYVSCSAMLEGEVVPLECGASVFNIGCRINYGSAVAPRLR